MSLCRSETEWNIALQICALIAPLIAVHGVKSGENRLSSFYVKVGEKMKIVLQISQNWPILPNILTTTEPVFTNASAFVDVYMQIIKLT